MKFCTDASFRVTLTKNRLKPVDCHFNSFNELLDFKEK